MRTLAIAIAISGLLWGGNSAAQPEDVIESFHADLLSIMQNAGELGYQGRYNVIAPRIESLFDLPVISRLILNRHWSDLSEAQRERFMDAFKQLSAATYASRFDSFSGQSFETVSLNEMSSGRVMVRTELDGPNTELVRLDYILQRQGDGWLIIGAIADGVNDLAIKRVEYSDIVESNGFDALLLDIAEQIRELEASIP